MTVSPGKLTRAEWEDPAGSWEGHFEGKDLGTGITVLFVVLDAPGGGPKRHTHPYDEVFILREGRGRYYVGDDVIDAEAGDVVLAPAGIPHTFENLGPGRMVSTDIHLSPTWIQTDLDD